MTVQELLEKLEALPKSYEIYILGYNDGFGGVLSASDPNDESYHTSVDLFASD